VKCVKFNTNFLTVNKSTLTLLSLSK